MVPSWNLIVPEKYDAAYKQSFTMTGDGSHAMAHMDALMAIVRGIERALAQASDNRDCPKGYDDIAARTAFRGVP
jgi:hypothetical protein